MTWRVCLTFAAILIVIRLSLVILMFVLAGPDRFWLGDFLWNSTDQAVYTSVIQQIADGNWLPVNLYARENLSHVFHPFFYLPGLLARWLHLDPRLAHELSFVVSLMATSYLIGHVISKSTNTQRQARLAMTLVLFAGGLGWLLTTWHSANGTLLIGYYTPDTGSEAFFFTTLFGAAHIPLSIGLLMFVLRRLWDDLQTKRTSRLGLLTIFLLLIIHPYFAPLLSVYALLIFASLNDRRIWRTSLPYGYGTCAAAAIAPHVWFYLHDPLRQFLLNANFLPLASPTALALAFGPWIILSFFSWRHKILSREQHQWIIIWFIAALACLPLFLFKRKLLEATGAGLIILATPLFVILVDRARRFGKMAWLGLLIVPFFSSFSLLQSQLALAAGARGQPDIFFVSSDLKQAWQWLRDNTVTSTMILPMDVWTGSWTAAYSQRRVYLGHNNETPSWTDKTVTLSKIQQATSSTDAASLIDQISADMILTNPIFCSGLCQRGIQQITTSTINFDDWTLFDARPQRHPTADSH